MSEPHQNNMLPDWGLLIVEHLEDALFSIDRQWRFTYLNRQASTIWGQSPEVLIGQNMWQAFPSLEGSKFGQMYHDAMSLGVTQRLEEFSVTTGRWYDVRIYPVTEGLLVCFQDISARKQAETALLQQLARARIQATVSRSLAEAINDYQAILDTATQQLAKVVGDGCIMHLISEDGQWLEHVSLHHRDPEATAFVREVLGGAPYQSVNEGFAGQVIQRGESMLIPAISQDRLKAMTNPRHWSYFDRFAISSILVVPMRATGRVIGLLTMTRHTPDQPYSNNDQTLAQDLADRVAIAIVNARLLKQIQHELNERIKAEQALRATQAQLLQSQKMESVGQLAGGIAHDFNNLLNVIIGYCDIVLDDLDEDDIHRADIGEILRAANRSADLVRQILAFSRQQVLDPRLVSLNEIVANMDTLLHRVLGEDIELVSLLDQDVALVLIDPGQIEQVIMNLAVNARDAMPDGGQLTVETAMAELNDHYRSTAHPDIKPGVYTMLAVSDTGVGMDQEIQEKIFEPFFTTKDPGEGTGLGLATVYGIVRQSEGYIWVYSEPGIGTTFKIYLPARNDLALSHDRSFHDHNERHTKAQPDEAEVRRDRTILLVEDEASVQELIHRVLSQAGYTIIKANNGQEALDLLAIHVGHIDLVVTDVVMPQLGGAALVERLKAQRPHLKILCMSGYTDRAAIRHRILQPCDSFLQKPFTPDVLLRQVSDLLRQSDEAAHF